MSLGWRITKKGSYRIPLPIISEEEAMLVKEVEERFRELVRIKEIGEEGLKKELREVIERVAEENGYLLEEEQKSYLVEYAYRHIYGYAFLDYLLEDESIEEIAIIGLGKPCYVYVREKGWVDVNATIEEEEFLVDLINKMAKTVGRRITFQNPRIDAMLKDGSRLHASIRPISEGEITIRKFRSTPLSPKEIVSLGTIDYFAMGVISLIAQSDSSIIIAGNTASGKTTTLNAIFSFIPKNERILITEETAEINIPHEHMVRLVESKEMGIRLMDLVYDSLRMRPDRIIVGEIRNGEEAKALIDVLLGGQARGAYATFHAQSSSEALQRLKTFGINEFDLNSIDLIVVQRRISIYEKRKLREVRKVTEMALVEDAKPLVFFSYDQLKGKWEKKDICSRIAERVGMSEGEARKEVKRRIALLKRAPKGYKEFFGFIQKELYGL